MILSRTMRESDYKELETEGMVVKDVFGAIRMWHPELHKHRMWEYTMALKALKTVFGNRKGLNVSDHGCGAGYMSPILYWLGHHVWMYECWAPQFENKQQWALEQMLRVKETRSEMTGWYEMWNKALGDLSEEDGGVDAAFCISTLEHVRGYQEGFRNLLKTVKPGGLAFLTTDFAEREEDDYLCGNLRAGRMFTSRTFVELYGIADEMGFRLVGDEQEWIWDESCRLVFDYGFASMALQKENRQ